jgi:hypothetical protein
MIAAALAAILVSAGLAHAKEASSGSSGSGSQTSKTDSCKAKHPSGEYMVPIKPKKNES